MDRFSGLEGAKVHDYRLPCGHCATHGHRAYHLQWQAIFGPLNRAEMSTSSPRKHKMAVGTRNVQNARSERGVERRGVST